MDGNRTAYGDPEKTNNAATKRERSVEKKEEKKGKII